MANKMAQKETIPSNLEEIFRGKLNKVFLYITDRCNLRCPWCLMGEPEGLDFPLDDINNILDWTKSMGAYDLTLIGGEPTIHPELFSIIRSAKDKDFKIVALDSNGTFDSSMFDSPDFCSLDKLCISLDAPTPEMHDYSRGRQGLFKKATDNLRQSLKKGLYTKITFTASNRNVHLASDMVKFAAELGVDELNFHLISRTGRGLYNDVVPDTRKWLDNCLRTLELYRKITPNLKLRIPVQFIEKEDFDKIKPHKCVSWEADRILFFPNGNIYSCSLLIGSKNTLGRYENGSFILDLNKNSELCRYHKNKTPRDSSESDVCPVQSDPESPHFESDSNLVPLCVSYKPAGGILNE
ncbi:radical SAM protein [Candidatus Woesearchaeota archaeon]|nr:radical SAM protein [Candidatus Woesearchaeota archaeon]